MSASSSPSPRRSGTSPSASARGKRAARSARRTTHFDLDFPREPQLEPYWCHKHRRECRPVETASQFLRRYTLDTLTRLKQFAHVRARGHAATVIHGDVREETLGRFDGVLTSP